MFNTGVYREIPLTKFGGLYTEADPRDLPAGASPLCYDVDFQIAGVSTRPGIQIAIANYAPPLSSGTFLYIKSMMLDNGLNQTLAQDAGGGLWAENIQVPGIMSRFYQGILNGARATSETIENREFITLSNLISGNDQPRQWNGQYLDRISQVGPGAGPSIPSVAAPLYSISEISEIYPAHGINTVIWGSYLNDVNAPPPSQNLYFMGTAGDNTFTTGLSVGDYVYVSGVGDMEGQNPNGTYQVVAIGDFTDENGVHQYFEVTSTQSVGDFQRNSATGTYQKTQALVQLSNPIPQTSAVVGASVTISGSPVQGWNSQWSIVATPTEGQLSISSTSLTSDVATYDYSVSSGNAPGWQPNFVYPMASQIVAPNGTVWQVTTPGTSGGTIPAFTSSPVTDGTVTWTEQSGTQMLVTVFNTNNGNGIFNVANAVITSATENSFTISLNNANVAAAAETGQAISGNGSALIIDPGSVTAGTGNPGTNPIYGDASGGQVTPTTSQVAAGQRYAICMFLTRAGNITPGSPPVMFYTTGSTTQLTFENIPLGPPNVIARIIAITAANSGIGGPYFWIPENVIIPGTTATLGQEQTINQTVVNDNVSTSLGPITFSDTVLIASTNVSITGDNAQQQRELGECVKCVQFAGRAFFIGERTKIDNFVNMTFDGGSVNGLPAGWEITAGLSAYVSLVGSLIFGQSLYVKNTSASTLNPYGTALASILSLYQGAYEDAFQAQIIDTDLAYSVRVTCASPSGIGIGSLVIELYSPSETKSWMAQIPLTSMSAVLQEFILPFNNPLWTPVPSDLVIRVYPLGLAVDADILVDRMEVFPTIEPVYQSQVAGSYIEDYEAIDGITGLIDISEFTSAPITNHFRFLNRYFVATNSRTFSPSNSTSEPDGWTVNEISNAVGSVGPLADSVGEEYMLTVSEDGAYVFDGGNHVKFSQEIQTLWNMIYEPSRATMWIKNDIGNQRILIGAPIPTPNVYLPNAPTISAPAYPNVVLMCSYLGLMNGAQIGEGMPVSVSMFTGSLLFHDIRRKWTIWQISSPMAAFIGRADGSKQLWLCGAPGSGQINYLYPEAVNDNGVAIASLYTTYGFSDRMTDEQLQLGSSRKIFGYALSNIEGQGNFDFTLLPETVDSPYPFTQAPFELSDPATDDVNIPLNETGNRAFAQIASDGEAETWWAFKRIVMGAGADPRIYVSGR